MASAAFEIEHHRQAARRAVPSVRVVQGGGYRLRRAKEIARQAATVLVVALILGLITAIVASQARITELSGEIDAKNSELSEARTTYDYLTSQMDEIANMSNLGAVAEKQLGLVKSDPSQITYVQVENESVIEHNESEAAKLLDGLRTAALSLIGNFDP